MHTFHITITNPADLDAMLTFLKDRPALHYELEEPVSAPSQNSMVYMYKPTSEFVEFCGSEHLSKGGLISEQGAIDVILSYAKRHHLYHAFAKKNSLYFGPYIELNEHLRYILKTPLKSISIGMISQHLQTLFKQVDI
jgi:hypothetical protein